MKKITGILTAVVVCMAVSVPASAGTATQALWQMGEDDPGAAAGNAINTTGADSSGNGHDLVLYDEWWPITGKPAEVPPNPILATYVTGAGSASSLAVSMSTGDPMYYYNNTISSLAADRGIEMWVRLSNTGQRRDAFWSNGLGFWNPGDQTIEFHVSGTGGLATFTYDDDAWYNLAIVTVGGQTSFYVDGVAQLLTHGAVAELPGYSFTHSGISGGDITLAGISGNNTPWDGAIDYVRVFDVTGTFDPMTDLTLSMNIPEPATMSLLALGGLAALIRRRKA